MDTEKVITGLNGIGCLIAEQIGVEQARNFLRTIDDAIAMLKEQHEKIEKARLFLKASGVDLDAMC